MRAITGPIMRQISPSGSRPVCLIDDCGWRSMVAMADLSHGDIGQRVCTDGHEVSAMSGHCPDGLPVPGID
ncbi:hypothetical protein [Streptomyces platensis]|uniref:hypothetical protein n=1 Tax=Streptomyces platensis TaxID=58346 RepID=UPI0036B7A99B